MKKIVALILAVTMVLSLGLLTGCSGTQGGTGNQGGNNSTTGNFTIPEGGYDGSAVTITFYHTMGADLRKVLEQYIEEFNKMYPNITIAHEQVGSYDDVRDQISTELTVNAQPNIAYCYPDHVALYNLTGKVVTLDNLISSTIEVERADGNKEILGMTDSQVSDFIEGYWNEGKQFGDGLMYTLPMSKSTEVMYYDATFFAEHNLTVPTTWAEMEKVCEQIKAIDPNCIPLGYDSESNWFINMCMQYGSDYTSASGDHFLFDNDTNKGFIKMFRDWYQKGYVTTQTLYGAYTSGLFTSDKGTRCYMCIGSSAGASHQRPAKGENGYPFDVGIATIPQVNKDKPQVISQGPSLCIFQSENPQEVIASWLFIKYLTTTVEFQAEFSTVSGYVPVLKSVAENEIYKTKFLDLADGGDYLTALSAKVCLSQVDAYYTSPAFNGSSTAREQVGGLLTAALSAADNGNLDALINRLFQDAIDECEYNS